MPRGSPTPAPDLASAGRLARRTFGVALMSDTKWRKLFSALRELPVARMTVKFIDVAEPRSLRFPPSLLCPRGYMDTGEVGPVELRAIEWLEIDADIAPLLASLGCFPLEPAGSGTRVVGYRCGRS